MKKLLLLLLFAGVASAAQKPNIIFIMVDDMGRDWVSCYGAEHQTPNIDRLAREGVLYQTAWCTPICTPTRVTLLTGQYPCHHGWVQHYDVPRWGGAGLRADRFTTFARLLREAGYATAIGGKWQVNHLGREPDALEKHDFAIRFRDGDKDIRNWKPAADSVAAGKSYAEYVKAALETDYIVGVFWCNPVDTPKGFGKPGVKQGFFDKELTKRPGLHDAVKKLNAYRDKVTPNR